MVCLASNAVAQEQEAEQESAEAAPSERVEALEPQVTQLQGELETTREQLAATQQQLSATSQQATEAAEQLEAQRQTEAQRAAWRDEQSIQLRESLSSISTATDSVVEGSPDAAALDAAQDALDQAQGLGQALGGGEQERTASAAAGYVAQAREQLAQRNYYDAQVSLANAALQTHAAGSSSGPPSPY
jgi:hypothetical protein